MQEDIEEYLFYIDFMLDLGLELTRAANYICDKVRQFIDPSFRIYEGVLLVGSTETPIRTEYQSNERNLLYPYRGLNYFFKEDRKVRDIKYYKVNHDKDKFHGFLISVGIDI